MILSDRGSGHWGVWGPERRPTGWAVPESSGQSSGVPSCRLVSLRMSQGMTWEIGEQKRKEEVPLRSEGMVMTDHEQQMCLPCINCPLMLPFPAWPHVHPELAQGSLEGRRPGGQSYQFLA